MRIDPADSAKWLAEGDKLSAHAIFPLVGKNLRTVQQWFADGLPHVVEERRGQPVRLTTLRAVREWARTRGVVLRAPAAPPTPQQQAEAEAGGPLLVQAKSDFEARVDAEVARRLELLVGDPDFDGRIVQFRQAFDAATKLLAGQGEKALTPAEVGPASTAVKNMSQELRQLEIAATEHRARRGELLEKRSVVRSLAALTDVLSNLRDSLPTAIATEVAAAVGREIAGEPGAGNNVGDRAGRAAMAAAEVEAAKSFVRIAEAVARACAEFREDPA